MKKLFTLALLAASPFALGNPGTASNLSTAHTMKASVMVIDMPQIMQQSPEVQKMAKSVETDLKKRQAEIIAKGKEVKDLRAELAKESATLSKSQRTDLEKKAMVAEREMNRMKEDYFQDARLAQNQVIQSVMEKVQKAANRLAAERHIDIILPKRAVIYANKQMDITADVLKDIKLAK